MCDLQKLKIKSNRKANTTTKKQYHIMLNFLNSHELLANSHLKFTPNTKKSVRSLWDELTNELNENGPPYRNVDGWRKVWADHKYILKKKGKKLENDGFVEENNKLEEEIIKAKDKIEEESTQIKKRKIIQFFKSEQEDENGTITDRESDDESQFKNDFKISSITVLDNNLNSDLPANISNDEGEIVRSIKSNDSLPPLSWRKKSRHNNRNPRPEVNIDNKIKQHQCDLMKLQIYEAKLRCLQLERDLNLTPSKYTQDIFYKNNYDEDDDEDGPLLEEMIKIDRHNAHNIKINDVIM